MGLDHTSSALARGSKSSSRAAMSSSASKPLRTLKTRLPGVGAQAACITRPRMTLARMEDLKATMMMIVKMRQTHGEIIGASAEFIESQGRASRVTSSLGKTLRRPYLDFLGTNLSSSIRANRGASSTTAHTPVPAPVPMAPSRVRTVEEEQAALNLTQLARGHDDGIRLLRQAMIVRELAFPIRSCS